MRLALFIVILVLHDPAGVRGQWYPNIEDTLVELWRYPIRLSNGIVRHDSRVVRRTCSNDVRGSVDSTQWNWTGEQWFKDGRVTSVVHRYNRSNRWSFDSLLYDSSARLSAVISFRNGAESSRTTYAYSNHAVKATMSFESTEYLLQEFAFSHQGLLESENLYSVTGNVQIRKVYVYSKAELDRLLQGVRDTTITYVLHCAEPPSTFSIRYYDFRGSELHRQTLIYSDGFPQIELDHKDGELVRIFLCERKEKDMVVFRELELDPVEQCLFETLHRYSIITPR